ncbi:MAG: twitching motility protein PilT [Planctomycetota bacterium]|nr:twitching motility protein PilT [Planctomycetota bacterium]MDA1211747.1 twitching motility protein PilT [Planctomycetota bacterium]
MIQPLHSRVLIDTGPLVAILDRNDQYHKLCTESLRTIQPPMWTTWPVITEAAWLLRSMPKGLQQLYGSIESGLVQIAHLPQSSLAELAKWQKRFQNLQPQLADLTLLYVAERETFPAIFTLDRRDFVVMQKKSRPSLVLLPEAVP